MSAITLYHGSSFDFDIVDLKQSRPYKDFGQGFYTSANRARAISIAERNADIERFRMQKSGNGHIIDKWLYQYRFDKDKAEGLMIKEFAMADREWGKFVTMNRNSRVTPHLFDIVIGPTANDFTNPTIQFYLSGGIGEVGSDAAIDELIRLLLPYKLPIQYFFATQRAVDCLTLARKERF